MLQVLPGTDREAVERADEVLRSFQGEEITDPTVFVKSAALGGLASIELAKLAQSKSGNEGVRNFAARVLKEQRAINAELASIARRERLDVPTSLIYEDEQMVKQGSEKSAAEFDAWYAQQMMSEIHKAIALFESASKMPDTKLAAFAKKTLPTLQDRQRLASDLTQGASQ
jgi:putative membrane protein